MKKSLTSTRQAARHDHFQPCCDSKETHDSDLLPTKVHGYVQPPFILPQYNCANLTTTPASLRNKQIRGHSFKARGRPICHKRSWSPHKQALRGRVIIAQLSSSLYTPMTVFENYHSTPTFRRQSFKIGPVKHCTNSERLFAVRRPSLC